MKVNHEFAPVYQEDSKILILGTIPSPKSRLEGFYYMHPQNRFWKVLNLVFDTTIGDSIEQKRQFLLQHRIALWDVLKSCEIKKASDASIRLIETNDIVGLIKKTKITSIFTTGKKATELYDKYCFPQTKIKAISLPSTSPANCTMKLEMLQEKYQIILKYLGEFHNI